MCDLNKTQAASMRLRATQLWLAADRLDPADQLELPGNEASGSFKVLRVIFPGGAVLTVAARGLGDGYVAEAATDLARFMFAEQAGAIGVRELRPANGDGTEGEEFIHVAQPETGAGGGK